ncbi:MAG: 30S ribosomal protein S6 [Alphaproteobacteria bacterium]|nr:30S ribosomal protein S6 [Alphaproteobacteria bacterium]
MPLYEHVFLVRPDLSVKQVESLLETYKSVIVEGNGSVGKTEYWGLRPTAYRIKKNRKAHYSLMNIDCSHEALTEMERQMSLNEDVLRFMSLRVNEWEESQSVMMRRDARTDRDRRPRESFARPTRGTRGERGFRSIGGEQERGIPQEAEAEREGSS